MNDLVVPGGGMEVQSRRCARPWAVLCLAAALLAAPGLAGAAITGSRHDFSGKAVDKGGACSVCHLPHPSSGASLLWARSLAEETAYFDQTADPAYIPGFTLNCYDCHDDANAVDNDPAPGDWTIGEEPQDIAFTDGPPPGGTLTGYYENYDGTKPGPGNPGPVDGSPTGGHFWKTEPTGTPDFKLGDKIYCALCHDPHNQKTGTNEAMIRTDTTDGTGGSIAIGDGLLAALPPNTRWGTGNGRDICAACHTYSDVGTPVTMWGNVLPNPPTTIPQHRQSNTTACTDCHLHNKISISCRECHGFPPLQTQAQAGGLFDRTARPDAENYAGGAGAHQRHKDALGDALFSCEICHGPSPGSGAYHNQGAGTVLQANVDVMGQSLWWDQDGTRANVRYTGTALAAGPAGYEFSAKGGGDQRCSGLSCHGDPPDLAGALNWTDDMLDEGTGNPEAGDDIRICKWCHDATPAVLDLGSGAVAAPNVLGDNDGAAGAWSGGSWGAEVSGHGLAAGSNYDQQSVGDGLGRSGAARDCTECHDGTYAVNGTPPPANLPAKTHFDQAYDSAEKRLRGTIAGQAIAGPDDACAACHQLTATGTQVSHHGNSGAGAYGPPLEGAFLRVCRQCHDVHGANWNGTGRNLYMVGRWLDPDRNGLGGAGEGAHVDSDAVDATVNVTTADNAVVFTSTTGADSFDESDIPGTEDADDICATCHVPASGGGAGTGGGLHNGLTSSFDMRGQDCMQCHDHDFDDDPATDDGFMPSGCEGCHGQDGIVHRGVDGTECTPDDAPNVMTVHVGGSWVSVWDGTWWDTQQSGDSSQQGGHGDPDGREGGDPSLTPTCLACHSTSDPPGTHLNGTFNSVGSELPRGSVNWTPQDCSPATPRPKGNANTNTSHLLPAYFTKYASGGGASLQQRAVDAYCYQECHSSNSVKVMTHERDGVPAVGAVVLGTHLTAPSVSYIMDVDLTTNAGGSPNHAPCVACHNPHGSVLTDSKIPIGDPGATNRMVIDYFQSPSTLCKTCHI